MTVHQMLFFFQARTSETHKSSGSEAHSVCRYSGGMILKKIASRTIYISSYSAAVLDEISLRRGYILQILGFLEPGWFVARLIMGSNGEIVRDRRVLGVVPENYVQCFQITRVTEDKI